MIAKQTYWIRRQDGPTALVEGAGQRDLWTKVHGYAETGEPGPTEIVHVVNEDPAIGPGVLPYAAVRDWAGLGWAVGGPPEPVDLTKDPQLADPASAPVAVPEKQMTAAAVGADSTKEK